MMHLPSSSYQLTCPDCQWRSPIHHENAISQDAAALTKCPICDQSHLHAQAVHMLDWLFEQAMHIDAHHKLDTLHAINNDLEAMSCSFVA
ncbi:hypothetical protein [Vitreoscilla stercoraria]|uniref:Uncharacterized protein n=1 Tax=Vitreoscilla stercoraria TaxID=61 RepID=A0ABY4EA67_VITST|nr:hypothetical protein [Vitreoscilla stercoraria]UOO92119.1 hypothetical protein LVJ81_10885 [Vitreoscilla stercoraria]